MREPGREPIGSILGVDEDTRQPNVNVTRDEVTRVIDALYRKGFDIIFDTDYDGDDAVCTPSMVIDAITPPGERKQVERVRELTRKASDSEQKTVFIDGWNGLIGLIKRENGKPH